ALPGVLLWLLVACVLKRPLAGWPEAAQWFAAIALGAASGAFGWALGWFSGVEPYAGVRWLAPMLAGAAMATAMFQWLRLRAQAKLPADTTAQLAELQSRIRPHFLFNTLNTALSLVRLDPARAEGVLEDLAELFRVALADQGESVTLAEEVELAKRYLAIEQIRFGERLKVSWELDPDAGHARVPPLRLQQQRRHARMAGVGVQLPAHLEPLAETDLLDREVALRELDFFGQGHRFALVGECDAEQLSQVFEHAFGARRVEPHQAQRGIERVEQEVRADARLQLGKLRRRVGRQLGLRAQAQPLEHRGRHRGAGEHRCEPTNACVGLDPAEPAERPAEGTAGRAGRDRSKPLRRHGPAGERPLEHARDEQPQQHAGQCDRRAAGHLVEPCGGVGGNEHHADRHHRVDEEQGTQHDADVADVEGQRLAAHRHLRHGIEQGAAERAGGELAGSRRIAPVAARAHRGGSKAAVVYRG